MLYGICRGIPYVTYDMFHFYVNHTKLCPIGTFSNVKGLSTDCETCPEGYNCDIEGIFDISDHLCEAGYYCAANVAGSAPNVNLCTAGNYCPTGASEPIPCPPGKYCPACTVDDASATGCAPKDCSEWPNSGVYCKGGLAEPEPCPAGSECPADSSLALPILCQPGTWQPDEGQTSCEPCTEGYFCPTTGITSTDQMGICHGGYEVR